MGLGDFKMKITNINCMFLSFDFFFSTKIAIKLRAKSLIVLQLLGNCQTSDTGFESPVDPYEGGGILLKSLESFHSFLLTMSSPLN